jgi:hypothetical protein
MSFILPASKTNQFFAGNQVLLKDCHLPLAPSMLYSIIFSFATPVMKDRLGYGSQVAKENHQHAPGL